jgi:hypothetical protein
MMPASTLRAWIIGIFWAVLSSVINQIFYFRCPSVSLGSVCAPLLALSSLPRCAEPNPSEQLVPQLLSFPIGKIWALYVPNVTLFGAKLNPGPFTIKEHVIVTIMASVGSYPAYAVCSDYHAVFHSVVETTISHATSRRISLLSRRSSSTKIQALVVSSGRSKLP